MSKVILPEHDLTIFCDDVREEVNGKLSIIGTYGNGINFSNPLPTILPKFILFTRVLGGDGEFDLTFKFHDPDGEDLLKERSPMHIKARPGIMGNLIIGLSPFRVSKQGEYSFEILIDGKPFHTKKFTVRVKEKNA
ncbi:MAG: hypothetical protein KAT46_00270 [Deltaproteobacteria bacterium]|nr:hypothetical protein [Deltaproteobacteria bacterium]